MALPGLATLGAVTGVGLVSWGQSLGAVAFLGVAGLLWSMRAEIRRRAWPAWVIAVGLGVVGSGQAATTDGGYLNGGLYASSLTLFMADEWLAVWAVMIGATCLWTMWRPEPPARGWPILALTGVGMLLALVESILLASDVDYVPVYNDSGYVSGNWPGTPRRCSG